MEKMKEKTAFAVIGVSGRGHGMMKELMSVEGVEIAAVCDKYEDRALHAADTVEEETGKRPQVFLDYHELLNVKEIVAVLCCTTWVTHSMIAIDAMRAGKHVAFEVGGAASVEECWQLVRTSEETGKFCMLLENCCYDKNELAIFNMKKLGIFGEIIHLEGGYEHDLRSEICLGRENRHGRLFNFLNRNGELYPTHQLGPIAKLIDINRGNRFLSLTSTASKARGLHEWIIQNKGKDSDLADAVFEQGDIVTTVIKCAHGETIVLKHDCSLPRPYSRAYRVHGTKGVYMEDGAQIYLEDEHKRNEAWEPAEPILEKYMHPLWREYYEIGVHEGGHGGMDFLVLSAFAEAAILNTRPPIDCYDAAAWMSITCLSEQSIALGSAPVAVPDFTNGKWIDREPYRRGRYCLNEVCKDFYNVK